MPATRGAGHDGAAARGRGVAGRDRGRCRASRTTRSRPARLHHPDDALGRRHHRDCRSAEGAVPGAIVGPAKEDICYATTNRQAAVKAIAPKIDALLVIGAPNSSNSRRLVEVGRCRGCGYSQLVQRATDIDGALEGIRAVGVTAGASAPEGAGERGDRRLRRALRADRRAGRDGARRTSSSRCRGSCAPPERGANGADRYGALPRTPGYLERLEDMADFFAWTDGACSGNPGRGLGRADARDGGQDCLPRSAS